jgi:hypothetical protein
MSHAATCFRYTSQTGVDRQAKPRTTTTVQCTWTPNVNSCGDATVVTWSVIPANLPAQLPSDGHCPTLDQIASRTTAVLFRRPLLGNRMQFMCKSKRNAVKSSDLRNAMRIDMPAVSLASPFDPVQDRYSARPLPAFAAATTVLDPRATEPFPANHEHAYALFPAQVWAHLSSFPLHRSQASGLCDGQLRVSLAFRALNTSQRGSLWPA